jgi:RND family efflux transporter MFP subunit
MKRYTLTLLTAMLAGCGGRHEPRAGAARTPVPVSIVEARTVEWPVVYEAAGTVRAATASTLASQVMGAVREVRVKAGDLVSAGQLLVLIDARDLNAGLEQARAAEQEARSGVAEADNGIASAKAQLALAEATFRRMSDLFAKRSLSDHEFDQVQANLRSAEAAYRMAVSKRAQLDARIARAAEGVESASVMRSHAEIRAPFAGVVTERRVEPGQLATPGAPLLTVERGGLYRLEAPVDESMLGVVRAGQTVSVLLETFAQPLTARVTEIVPVIDPVSRAFVVKAALPAGPSIRSGMFGRLRVQRGVQKTIAVPAAAVVQRGSLQNVLVVDGGVARVRIVTTGQTHEAHAEILSGLEAGDRVIHPRPPNLADGVAVEVRP